MESPMKDAIREQLRRIFEATHSGTVDLPTVDDACQKISEYVERTPMPVLERAKEALKPNVTHKRRKSA